MSKSSFKFRQKKQVAEIGGKPVHEITYSAQFWFGPSSPGEVGERRTVSCRDEALPVFRDNRFVGYSFLSASRNVSYYSELVKAAGLRMAS